jgi:hypothetical protein
MEVGVQILVNSDNHIGVDSHVIGFVGGEVNRVLKRFAGSLTRVEVHLRDLNSHKSGTHDKRCLVEARPAHHRAMTATCDAGTVGGAVEGALKKMRSSLETAFGRLGRVHIKAAVPPSVKKAAVAKKKTTAVVAKKTATAKVAAPKVAARKGSVDSREPKKKAIYQARRKAWPAAAAGHGF